ncbi:AmmeMemoRadiSam system protein A [Chitinilyticum litopenaei]|uniref:AmmeMemoRadiSam system protein A n=1 Tax=Chitinilyticum litopenaei TaxID=1121276 RepID=UPI00041A3304|nr:AmmeMemoRadiSam system protein A [Chitinilyticum litopenaei]
MPALTEQQGQLLLGIARRSIRQHLEGMAMEPFPGESFLDIPAATFVTLTQNGQLRGCIGSLAAWRRLGEDVRGNAIASATRDPRFPALLPSELPLTRIEVSVLSPAEPLPFRDEADLLSQLRPHTDGLILHHGAQQATFLPQVWHQLPEAAEFLAHLKMKAGLPPDCATEDLRFERYTVQKWLEKPH